MNKLNGSTMTQIEKSNTCLNMASRINALFVEAENEVEFSKQDIMDIFGTCIRNITGEHGVLCLTGDTQARPEFNAYSGKIAIHSVSPSNNTCLVIDEWGRSGLVPFFQIKSEPESQIKKSNKLSEPSEDARKYMAKLAKEKTAQGITIQSDPKQEQHQEKLNLINDARDRVLNDLFYGRIENGEITTDERWVKLIIIAVKELFSNLDVNDKYLNAKLTMIINAADSSSFYFESVVDDFNEAKELVISRARAIRKNTDLIFFQLD